MNRLIRNTSISLSSIVERKNKQVLSSELGDDFVFMDPETGDYLGLNKVARDIWVKIENPISAGDILTYLINKYNVPEQQCKANLLAFLNQMKKRNMLLIK